MEEKMAGIPPALLVFRKDRDEEEKSIAELVFELPKEAVQILSNWIPQDLINLISEYHMNEYSFDADQYFSIMARHDNVVIMVVNIVDFNRDQDQKIIYLNKNHFTMKNLGNPTILENTILSMFSVKAEYNPNNDNEMKYIFIKSQNMIFISVSIGYETDRYDIMIKFYGVSLTGGKIKRLTEILDSIKGRMEAYTKDNGY